MRQGPLDKELAAAFAEGNGALIAKAYHRAGQALLEDGHIDAACFYLTNAYIFALEAGAPVSNELHEILVSHGREA